MNQMKETNGKDELKKSISLEAKVKLNNGIEMPILGLGTWNSKGEDVQNAVKWAIESGYRHIDTASFYGNELEIGKAIKESGFPREELFITSKLWNNEQGYDNALKAYDRSLISLGVKYLDLYLIHWPVSEIRNETWKALEYLLKDGKVRAIGVSNFTTRHLEELISGADIIPAINQIEFSPFLYQEELLKSCTLKGIQVEAYSPLTRKRKFDNEILTKTAMKYGKSVAQILLRWGLQHNLVIIPKSSNKNRIKENTEIFDFEIKEEDMNVLDNLNEKFRVTVWNPESEMFN